LFVFQTQKAFEHYAEFDTLLRNHFNVRATAWDAKTLEAKEPALQPGAAAGAWHYAGDAQLRPDRFMTQLRDILKGLGVRIIEEATLQGMKYDGTTAISAVTTAGEYNADKYLIATGAWTPQLDALLGTRLPIIPGKGYSLTMPRPALCPTYPMIFEEHRVAISPFATGYRIGSTMEFTGYDDSVNPKRLDLLKEGARVYLREPMAEPVQERWAGWRPMTYDGNPIIDYAPRGKNVMIAAGHGMLGLSMATGTGRLVADILSQQTPAIDPTPYQLRRFR
ncbi:MAG: NAD(P)/FAD-dependent oxidoreductase, partial [Gemmataceae bacterium]